MNERAFTFDLNKIIEDFTSSVRNESQHRPHHVLQYNRYRTEQGLLLEFILPGYKETDILLEFVKDALVIAIKNPHREVSGIVEQQNYHWKDIPPVRIPISAEQYNHENVQATLKEGVLSVAVSSLASQPNNAAKKIKIKKEE